MTRQWLSTVRRAVDDADVIDAIAGTPPATIGRTVPETGIALVHLGPLITK